MKNWNGTRGEVRYKSLGKGRYDVVNYDNVLIAELDIEITPPYIRNTGEAQYENVNLICNAFNTIQKCDLLPSELLERYNEAVHLIKGMKLSMQANPSFNPEGGEFFDFVESAEDLIKKHESC